MFFFVLITVNLGGALKQSRIDEFGLLNQLQ
jgi:hypothetical protein